MTQIQHFDNREDGIEGREGDEKDEDYKNVHETRRNYSTH